MVAERDVRRVIVFGESLVELVRDIPSCSMVLDVCDSTALTQSRAFAHAGGFRGGRNWRDALDLYRARRTEARLPALFDAVTTVGDVDTAEIVKRSGTAANVFTVPNGVDDAFLAPMPPPPAQRRGGGVLGQPGFRAERTRAELLLRRGVVSRAASRRGWRSR